jgi:hypothetical protein
VDVRHPTATAMTLFAVCETDARPRCSGSRAIPLPRGTCRQCCVGVHLAFLFPFVLLPVNSVPSGHRALWAGEARTPHPIQHHRRGSRQPRRPFTGATTLCSICSVTRGRI